MVLIMKQIISFFSHNTTIISNCVHLVCPRDIHPTYLSTVLGDYGKVPISHYNGIPMVLLPVTELKTKWYSLLITLSYHASGVKPDQRPGKDIHTTHYLMNYGNCLWAITGCIAGFSYADLQIGTHLNSIFNPGKNGYRPRLELKDNQKTIVFGAYYAQTLYYYNRQL